VIAPGKRDRNTIYYIAISSRPSVFFVINSEGVAALVWPHAYFRNASYGLNQKIVHLGIAVPVRGRDMNTQNVIVSLVFVPAIVYSLVNLEIVLASGFTGFVRGTRIVESFCDVVAQLFG
jgi:hypothetical protein